MSQPLPRTLFVGAGAGAVAWYRCALPAMALGCEWVGVAGQPPDLAVGTGLAKGRMSFADFFDYEVLVIQQPIGPGWVTAIRDLQAAGIRVLFEIDDYVHAIRKMEDHEFAAQFGKDTAAAYELGMSLCDGVIVSTEFLARRFRAFNKNLWVCRNGLDLKRYALTRPPHDGVTVGWSGATGHREAVRPWLAAVADVMREREDVRFLSVGQQFSDGLAAEFGAARASTIPFAELGTYPAAMANFDVALAPAGKNHFFKGKSDLRWLEASALGIPVIADPDVYPDIEHGVTGFHAADAREAREILRELVADPALRARVGGAARAHVREHRAAEKTAQAWSEAIRAVRPAVVEPV